VQPSCVVWYRARLLIAGLALLTHSNELGNLNAAEPPVPDSPLWLIYSDEQGTGNGKHIVLIAAAQEYRVRVSAYRTG
jgi:hypothetical protein